jgi:gas vesicle protein
VGDTVSNAPNAVARKAQGSPIAAGLIAFGAGLLVSSLLPPSKTEQQAAEKVKDTAQPMVDDLTDIAKEVAGSLKEPAQQALEGVQSAASDAAATIKDDATSAAGDVTSQAQNAKDTVQHAAQ